MDIPLKFREKMGIYDIQMNGVGVKVTVVDNEALVESGISELKAQLGDLPLVGIDMKICKKRSMDPELLLMYANERCLIVQLALMNSFPNTLGTFLSDKRICFVGWQIQAKYDALAKALKRLNNMNAAYEDCVTRNGFKISDLAAATVLKNPALQKCGSLEKLASKIGFNIVEEANPDRIECPEWNALCFSEEEVKFAVYDAYNCYHMGKKLLSML